MATTPRVAADKTERRERIPMSVPRAKLGVNVIPQGYHLHWVNDDGGRIHHAQQGGYEFCTYEEVGLQSNQSGETHVKRLVGKLENGEGMFAYLMKIRQDWFDADQAEIQRDIDRVETAIKTGKLEAKASDNRYIPSTGIKIS